MGLVGEDVGEVHVVGDPVHSKAPDAVGADALRYDGLEVAAVGIRPVNAVKADEIEFYPVDVVFGIMEVHVKNVVPCDTGNKNLRWGYGEI